MGTLIDEISFHTRIEKEIIESFLFGSERYVDHYKLTFIPKKSGGSRKIFLPSREIKLVQYYLKERYLSRFSIHSAATAYITGKSITDNAYPHRNNKSFLFMDVSKFFDSIDFGFLLEIMEKEASNFNLDRAKLEDLLLLCSRKRVFVQGCVTSPILSNIYMRYFDATISDLVKTLACGVYTRYSDDITISSTEKIPETIKVNVANELGKLKLSINEKKTHYSSNLNNVRITGIRIKNNNEICLDTHFKKELKTRIYHLLNNSKCEDNVESVIGLLNYMKMVDLKYYNHINFKYTSSDGRCCITRLKQILNKKNESQH